MGKRRHQRTDDIIPDLLRLTPEAPYPERTFK
jgi:hypothetical protein